MIPVAPDRIKELLVENSGVVLTQASRKYVINGFACVFEVGQNQPCFYFAINTVENGSADPSTGEWDYPADGFDGAGLSEQWRDCYWQLHAYMENSEEKLREVQSIMCAAMNAVREQWGERLPDCIFTVNECNDDDETVRKNYQDINQR